MVEQISLWQLVVFLGSSGILALFIAKFLDGVKNMIIWQNEKQVVVNHMTSEIVELVEEILNWRPVYPVHDLPFEPDHIEHLEQLTEKAGEISNQAGRAIRKVIRALKGLPDRMREQEEVAETQALTKMKRSTAPGPKELDEYLGYKKLCDHYGMLYWERCLRDLDCKISFLADELLQFARRKDTRKDLQWIVGYKKRKARPHGRYTEIIRSIRSKFR